MLLICRNDYWPSFTPTTLWELPEELWGPLALMCDQITAENKRLREEAESRRR